MMSGILLYYTTTVVGSIRNVSMGGRNDGMGSGLSDG